MKLQTSQIDLDSLQVDKTKANFSLENNQSEIEYLARTIVELEGWSIRIPIVKEIGIEEYKLVSGYFDYYALLKAREINPELPDRIRVFIIDKRNQDAVLNQLKSIEKLEKISQQPQEKQSSNNNQDTRDIKISNLSSKIQDSEQVIIKNLDALKTAIVNEINSKIPEPLPLLDAFNKILDDRVCETVLKQMSFLRGNKAQKIVNKLRDYQKKEQTEFKTFQDVLNKALGKGYISKAKLLEVIDNFDGNLLDKQNKDVAIIKTKIKQSSNNNQDTKDIKFSNLFSKIQDSEQVIISNLDTLKTAILNEINSKIPKPLPLLDALNQILDDRVSEIVLKKISFLGKKKAQKIVNQLKDKKKTKNIQFNTFQDVLSSLEKGSISKEKLLEVIDSWN